MIQNFSDEYLDEYLKYLGLEINEQNRKLSLWALNAPVPAGWKEGVSEEGDVYYWKEDENQEK